jgi:AcrR family transcriptional regulator
MAATEARSRLLETACILFYKYGVHAVGIDRVIAEAGVSKATLYRHFPTKDHLVVAYVQLRDQRWRNWMTARVGVLAADPVDRPLAVFDAVAERCASGDFRGCAFTNTIVDVADRSHPAHRAAAQHKDQVRAYFAELLADAGVLESEPLAQLWLMLLDGAVVTALREGSAVPAEAARQAAAVLLSAAVCR